MLADTIENKVATHGGRFLTITDHHGIHEDTNYDMSRTPGDLASSGSIFKCGNDDLLEDAKGQRVVFKDHHLRLKKIAPEEVFFLWWSCCDNNGDPKKISLDFVLLT